MCRATLDTIMMRVLTQSQLHQIVLCCKLSMDLLLPALLLM